MTKEIERSGIPIVQVTNLSKIAEGIGSNRIFRGNSVLHVFGDPSLPRENELEYRKNAVMQALKMLKIVPKEGKSIVKEIA
jgi:glycine reductase